MHYVEKAEPDHSRYSYLSLRPQSTYTISTNDETSFGLLVNTDCFRAAAELFMS
jgi:hypothetical protein